MLFHSFSFFNIIINLYSFYNLLKFTGKQRIFVFRTWPLRNKRTIISYLEGPPSSPSSQAKKQSSFSSMAFSSTVSLSQSSFSCLTQFLPASRKTPLRFSSLRPIKAAAEPPKETPPQPAAENKDAASGSTDVQPATQAPKRPKRPVYSSMNSLKLHQKCAISVVSTNTYLNIKNVKIFNSKFWIVF